MDKSTGSVAVGRVFIVGSARSGTTLVQAMLAAHPDVFTLPETHFFCETAPKARRYRWTGLADKAVFRKGLEQTARLARRPDLVPGLPSTNLYQGAYYRGYLGLLDRACTDAGKRIWVEKTPHHIDYLRIIERRAPRARIVHVLRDGRDVVASQYHAQQQDPEFWRKWTIEKMAETWNADIAKSLAYRNNTGHLLVTYEAVIADVEGQLRAIAAFLGFDFDPAMLDHRRAADDVLGWRRQHPWMTNVLNPIQDTRLKKFMSVFSDEQRRSVEGVLNWSGDVAGELAANMT